MTPALQTPPVRAALRAAYCAAVGLWSAGVMVDLARTPLHGSPGGRTVLACFALDAEQSAPAWFSSSLLWTSALLFALIGSRERSPGLRRGWLACALATLFLSMDEAVSLHERLGNAVHRQLPALGLHTFAWVLPGALAVLAGGALLVRFARTLPPLLRTRLLTAAALWAAGALGFEALGAWLHATAGEASLAYQAEVWLEEGCELAGALACTRALALHLAPDQHSPPPGTAEHDVRTSRPEPGARRPPTRRTPHETVPWDAPHS